MQIETVMFFFVKRRFFVVGRGGKWRQDFFWELKRHDMIFIIRLIKKSHENEKMSLIK